VPTAAQKFATHKQANAVGAILSVARKFLAYMRPDGWRAFSGSSTERSPGSPQLTKNRLSDNVGGVKYFLSVLTPALVRARHFALAEAVPFQPRLARNQFRNSVRPMHLFGHNVDHDYYFELPGEGERDTQSIARCSTSHHGDFQVVPRANRTLSTARNPIPCVASSTNEPPVSAPWRLWRSSVLVASSDGNTYSAIPGGCAPSLAPLPPAGNATESSLVS